MAQDVASEVAGLISSSKVFGSSENIRHGKYVFLIKRIFAELVESDRGKHKMAFWELTPVKSETNPQVEGDHTDYPNMAGPLKDDGMRPNPVGGNCALKVDFDGPGGRSAGANIKSAILGLFGKRDGEISDAEVDDTWLDLSLQRNLKSGERYPGSNKIAATDKLANPACGMLIGCTTVPKRKKTPNDKGAYITRLNWFCVSPPGQGENAPDKVAERRKQIEAQMAEDEEDTAPTQAALPPPAPQATLPQQPAALPGYAAPQQQYAVPQMGVPQPGYPQVAMQPATQAIQPQPGAAQAFAQPYPSAPPPPVVAAPAPVGFKPNPPWIPHPSAPPGATPEQRWFWSDPKLGGDNTVKSEAQFLRGQ